MTRGLKGTGLQLKCKFRDENGKVCGKKGSAAPITVKGHTYYQVSHWDSRKGKIVKHHYGRLKAPPITKKHIPNRPAEQDPDFTPHFENLPRGRKALKR